MFLDGLMKFFSGDNKQQAASKPQTINEEAGLGPEWQPIDAAPIVPSQMLPSGAADGSTKYLQGSVGPAFQHDSTFVETAYRSPNAPQLTLMPMGPNGIAQNNAAVSSVINETSQVTNITSSGLTWRGTWNNFTLYNVNDLVQFNQSTYIAIKGNKAQEPDNNPTNWTLVSENFVFGASVSTPGTAGFGAFDKSIATDGSPEPATAGPLSPSNLTGWALLASESVNNGGFASPPSGFSDILNNVFVELSVGSFSNANPVFTSQGVASPAWSTNLLLFAGPGFSVTAALTSVAVSSNVLTIQAINSFVVGTQVKFSSVATATFLNGSTVTITAATATSFTANFTHANYGPTADSGTATNLPYLQTANGTFSASGTQTQNIVLPNTVKQGSTILVLMAISDQNGFGTITSVNDGHSSSYSVKNSGGFSFGQTNFAFLQNVVAGSYTVAVTVNTNTTTYFIAAFELPGGGSSMINTYLPFDVEQFRGSTFICLTKTTQDAFAAPSNWGMIAQGTGFVDSLTGAYNATATDYGRLISNATASNFAVTLPNPPPSNSWWVALEASSTGTLTISPNGLNLDGVSSNLALGKNQGIFVFTDGTNYYTIRGIGTVTSFSAGNLSPLFTTSVATSTTTPALSFAQISQSGNLVFASPNGSSGNPTFRALVGADLPAGVNSQTASYAAVAADTYKLISFNSASAVTLTLPNPAPSANYLIHVQNVGAGILTISRNSLTIDGASSNLVLQQNEGVVIYSDGTNYFTMRGVVSLGGVNSQTANYTAVGADNGKLVSLNSASALTLTLPATPPSPNWMIFVQCVGAGGVTISRNSLTIDGAAANVSLTQAQGLIVFTDGTNYFTSRGVSGSGASSNAGGVNAQTISYTAIAGDSGKLVTMNGSSLTLTLPASPPSATWWIAVENTNATALTVSRNGLTIDGAASNLTLNQNQGILVYTDGSNYFTERGTGGGSTNAGGVNAQTANYLAVAGDSGKLVSMNGASLTLTLPAAPPSSTWWIAVENVNATSLTVSPNSLNIDGSASNLSLTQNQGVLIFTDGTNYFTSRGMGSGGGGSSVGGVNSQTADYTALSGDSGKLISFNKATAVNLTLPSSPPSSTWFIDVENRGAGILNILRNGLTIDGSNLSFVLKQNEGVRVFTDGSNYFLQMRDTGIPRPNTKRIAYMCADGTAGLPSTLGVGDKLTAGQTVSGAAGSSTLPPYIQATSSAVTGSASFIESTNLIYWTGRNIRAQFFSQITDFTAGRMWVGMASGNNSGSDSPAVSQASFRASKTVPDTNFQCVTGDGSGSQTVTDSGIAVDTNFHRFEIIFNDNLATPNVQFFIDGALVATNTTHLPAASTAMVAVVSFTATTNSARVCRAAWLYVESDF